MSGKRKRNALWRDGDLGGDADAVSAENADGLLNVLFRGLTRTFQTKRSESASDLENQLTEHRQNECTYVL